MQSNDSDMVRSVVRERYGRAASGETGEACCGPSCCGGNDASETELLSREMGYDPAELADIPGEANLGLGCGNPGAIAALSPGETVLDLGSGGGIDCFLAARQVGPTGRVIGVDMTPEMVVRARKTARSGGFEQVEFRLGEIEHLPVEDASVDVVISNCVINLSPEKPQVFREVFRVLKPGGRLAISDVVVTAELPEDIRQSVEMYVGCIAGAAGIDELQEMMEQAGFRDVSIAPKDERRELIRQWTPDSGAEDYIASAIIEARKPA